MTTAVHMRPLLTIPQAAERLAVSEKTVRRLIDAEILPALRLTSRVVRIDPAELDRWLYDEVTGGTPAPVTPAERRGPEIAPASRATAAGGAKGVGVT